MDIMEQLNDIYTQEEIEEFVKQQTYHQNTSNVDNILMKIGLNDDCNESTLDDETRTKLMYLFFVSKKYDYKYEEVKEVIVKNVYPNLDFTLEIAIFYVPFLKSKEEKELFLEEQIIDKINDSLISKISCGNVLGYVLDVDKYINRRKYKEKIADMYYQAALILEPMDALNYMSQAVEIYKTLGYNQKHDEALAKLIKINEQVVSGMKEYTIAIPKELGAAIDKRNKRLASCVRLYADDNILHLIQALVNPTINVIDKMFDQFEPIYLSKRDTYDTKTSIMDLTSRKTFDAHNRIVKSLSQKEGMDNTIRSIYRLGVNAIMQEVKRKIDDLEEEAMSSPFIFEEDKVHIQEIFNQYKEGNYLVFIYLVVPNIEKILRNLLFFNDVPECTTMRIDSSRQSILNLTEILECIKKEQLLDDAVVDSINEKMNDERFENYRNKLCHRFDESMFNETVANDLFFLLLNLIFYYFKEGGKATFYGDDKELERLMKQRDE